jgi:hypothetical protein
MRPRAIGFVVLAIALLMTLPASALEEEGHESGSHEDAESTHGDEHGEHEFHRHHFSVFLGVTYFEEEKETEEGGHQTETTGTFTLGVDYEYRLNRRWGVGALADYAGADFRAFIVGVPIFLHVGQNWRLIVAPGLENKDEVEPMVRFGVNYDLEVGTWSITPAINLDINEHEQTLVFGVNIGRGF